MRCLSIKTFQLFSKTSKSSKHVFRNVLRDYKFSTKSSCQPVTIKKWTKYVEPIEEEAKKQLENIAKLGPHVVHGHIAVMPDVHLGKGATVGSVIPTKRVIIPAAVGVDIGCGMCAIKTSLKLNDIKLDNLSKVRKLIENVIPLGFDGCDDAKFKNLNLMKENFNIWNQKLKVGYDKLISIKPSPTLKKSQIDIIKNSNSVNHLGSLGGGNHFIEICIDNTEDQNIWIMLHSGSRGIGNAIGRTFIEIAKEDMLKHYGNIPLDKELAYLTKGTENFEHYWFAVKWAQNFASLNREIMMNRIIDVLNSSNIFPKFKYDLLAINCHHNYVDSEVHNGEELYITRKGAVSAKKGQFGIIPGSMGAKSYIVKGKGNSESYCSCSHGAGRRLSRNQAKKEFSIEDLKAQTKGVECKKDNTVLDEIPSAYKDIDKVMESQIELVEVYCCLKQILCVKG
jgi:tRNA-splicing ligase RtcB